MRVGSEEYAALPLRAHALLADAPLHDVWAVDLPGGGPGRTLRDLRALLEAHPLVEANPVVRRLFAARRAVGRIFGWDGPGQGSLESRFRTRFESDSESIAEIRNATVHAFLVYVLVARERGYRLYWAVHVKPVGAITALYMRVIDPFRRWIVYPALLNRIRELWTAGPGRRRRVLLSAFAPYGPWRANASELALRALQVDPPQGVELVLRVYPVDFDALERRLGEDLAAGFDLALHLGQAPGGAQIALEALARNLRCEAESGEGEPVPLLPGGPELLASGLPLAAWAERLREAGIPAAVSRDAGRYLCNAALYRSLWTCRERGLATRCGFVHIPLTPEQAEGAPGAGPGLPTASAARAVRTLLELGILRYGAYRI